MIVYELYKEKNITTFFLMAYKLFLYMSFFLFKKY